MEFLAINILLKIMEIAPNNFVGHYVRFSNISSCSSMKTTVPEAF